MHVAVLLYRIFFRPKYIIKMHHLNNYIVKYTEQLNMHKMVSSTMQG